MSCNCNRWTYSNGKGRNWLVETPFKKSPQILTRSNRAYSFPLDWKQYTTNWWLGAFILHSSKAYINIWHFFLVIQWCVQHALRFYEMEIIRAFPTSSATQSLGQCSAWVKKNCFDRSKKRNDYKAFRFSGEVNVFAVKTCGSRSVILPSRWTRVNLHWFNRTDNLPYHKRKYQEKKKIYLSKREKNSQILCKHNENGCG